MDLRRLITLKTIVEEGSFARAASKLCCTQSTVTFQIKQLERELSIILFEKIGRRMVMTSAARNILPHIHEMIRVMSNLRQVANDSESPSGELRIASGETLLAYKMPGVLKLFKQRAPQVRLSLQSLNCYKIRDSLLADQTDLGIFYRVGNDSGLTVESYGEQELVLVASPLFPGADFMLSHQHIPTSFIINEPQCVFRQIFEHTLRQRQITLENTIELWSIESIKQCVAGNIGVSYLPRFAVEKEIISGELKELIFSPSPQTITSVCAYHSGKFVSPAMRVFMDCMQDAFGSGTAVLTSPHRSSGYK